MHTISTHTIVALFPSAVKQTIHTEILKREMDNACQRKQYRRIIRYPKKLKTYSDRENAARMLAEHKYVYHKNRPALKNELKKASIRRNKRTLTVYVVTWTSSVYVLKILKTITSLHEPNDRMCFY